MTASVPRSPVVHLELHTADLARARAFYATLCGWRAEPIDTMNGSYLALELGNNLGGGIVECSSQHAIWLPYVEVAQIETATIWRDNSEPPCSSGLGRAQRAGVV